jgi:retron-type reverse transcriptase
MRTYKNLYGRIASFENLLYAYKEFSKGKRFKSGVLDFNYGYEKELFKLREELVNHTYVPLEPRRFYVYEPKKRAIEAAAVRDRVVHHALCRVIEPIFDKRLIYDTYACRLNKGTLAAIRRFEEFKRKLLSRGNENEIYVFKADISKYFENVNHDILLGLISERIKDNDIIRLIAKILDPENKSLSQSKSIPIGNLTSQFFANLYLNPLDQFVKHDLRIRCYIRYMDDFVLMDSSKARLHKAKAEIDRFLEEKLQLRLHPKKQAITPLRCGIDFLGFRIFPAHRLLRKENARRFIRKLKKMKREFKNKEITLARVSASIKGWLAHAKHGDTYKLRKNILRDFVLMPI